MLLFAVLVYSHGRCDNSHKRDILTACCCLLYWFTHTGDVIIPTKQTYNLPFKGVVKSTSSRSVEPGRLEKCISIEKGGTGEGSSVFL